jgi:hypothetical protein
MRTHRFMRRVALIIAGPRPLVPSARGITIGPVRFVGDRP